MCVDVLERRKKIFLRQRLDVCALSDIKLKGKGEVKFGVAGREGG